MSTCNVYRFLILILKWWYFFVTFLTFISIFMNTELQLRAPQPVCVCVCLSSDFLSLLPRCCSQLSLCPLYRRLRRPSLIEKSISHLPEAKYERQAEEHHVKKPLTFFSDAGVIIPKCCGVCRDQWTNAAGKKGNAEHFNTALIVWLVSPKIHLGETTLSFSASAGHFYSSRLHLL